MTFEKVSFNQAAGDFEATILGEERTFQMTLLDFDENQTDQAVALTSKICNWLSSNLHTVKIFSASKLIELKNSTWLEEDEGPINEQDFINTIELEAINAYSDGGFNIFFNDNDLFWGYNIVVNVCGDFTLKDA